jgi:hypothetical protein
MKTNSIERIFILLAFNIFRIASIIFGLSLLLAVFSYILFNQIPLINSYIFWFSFGVYGSSLVIRKVTAYLEKKYEEKNDYYLNLLGKHKKPF